MIIAQPQPQREERATWARKREDGGERGIIALQWNRVIPCQAMAEHDSSQAKRDLFSTSLAHMLLLPRSPTPNLR